MLNLFSKDREPTWYPGVRIVRDRWGTPINPNMAAREFRAADDARSSSINSMRWSLGLM